MQHHEIWGKKNIGAENAVWLKKTRLGPSWIPLAGATREFSRT